MLRKLLITLPVCALGAVPGLADPILSPISQQRSTAVEASVRIDEELLTDADSTEALDFGPFNGSVSASAQGVTNPAKSGATASQQSQITSTALFGSGSVNADADAGAGLEMSGFAESLFIVAFSLAEPADYLLSGTISAQIPGGDPGFPAAGITLSDNTGDLYTSQTTAGVSPILSSGTLVPGTYTLSVFAAAVTDAPGQNATADFDFNFSIVPEPTNLTLALLVGALAFYRRQ